jgi:hypothetical protein
MSTLQGKPIINMCQHLNIKIAVIKRLSSDTKGLAHQARLASKLLGCNVSNQLVSYVLMYDNNQIIGDVTKGVMIAVELDNLQLNWD